MSLFTRPEFLFYSNQNGTAERPLHQVRVIVDGKGRTFESNRADCALARAEFALMCVDRERARGVAK